MTVLSVGESLAKVFPELKGSNFESYFKVERPLRAKPNYKSLHSLSRQIMIIRSQVNPLTFKFRGQTVEVFEGELFFLGSIWVKNVTELKNFGLVLNDFALSDPTTDILQLLQANQIASDDISDLNSHLQKSQKKFHSLFQNSNDAIFLHTPKGDILDSNIKAQILTGKPNAVLKRMNVLDVFVVEENSRLDFSTNNRTEISLFDLEGNQVICDLAYNSIDDDGQIVIQSILRDITQQKQEQKDLEKAKEMAEASAKAKQQFLANMSHEIRTPLNGVMGLTNLLNSTELNEKQKNYLEAISKSSNTLMVVINDILDFSKIEAGKLNIASHHFELRETLNSVVQILQERIDQKEIDFSLDVESKIPNKLTGDPSRLSQILFNIIGNSIKFTKRGRIDVNVSILEKLDEKTEEKVNLQFSISDTGIGIPKDKQATIFEAFTQADGEDNRNYEGTGLGLSIVKKLIELQSGEVSLRSTEGKGTTIVFSIPFTVNNTIKKAAKSMECAHCDNYSCLGQKRILIAEDNPINQLVIKDVLKKVNAVPYLVNDGKEVMEILGDEHFDLLILDMQMPIMDGYETLDRLKTSKFYESLPVIALTANATQGEKDRVLKLGASEYLAKPFNPKDLYSKIAGLTEPVCDWQKALDPSAVE
ncbi:MAG: hypothetical protein SchgKO_04450 [Schleiferiaceae bacterium]